MGQFLIQNFWKIPCKDMLCWLFSNKLQNQTCNAATEKDSRMTFSWKFTKILETVITQEAIILGVLYEKVFLEIQAFNFIKKETLAQVFSCEFYEISKNNPFVEHLQEVASDPLGHLLQADSASYIVSTAFKPK